MNQRFLTIPKVSVTYINKNNLKLAKDVTFVDAFFGTKWMIILNRRLSWQVNELRLFQAKKVKINCHVFRDIQLIIKRLHYVKQYEKWYISYLCQNHLIHDEYYLFRNQEFNKFKMLKTSYEGNTYDNKRYYLNRLKKRRACKFFVFVLYFLIFLNSHDISLDILQL